MCANLKKNSSAQEVIVLRVQTEPYELVSRLSSLLRVA
jgi:hypothetical protein